jgi:FLYWCH zinc finger domain
LKGRKGGYHLVHDNFIYRSNFRRQGTERNVYYWECIHNRKMHCRGRLKTVGDKLFIANSNGKRVISTRKHNFSHKLFRDYRTAQS